MIRNDRQAICPASRREIPPLQVATEEFVHVSKPSRSAGFVAVDVGRPNG